MEVTADEHDGHDQAHDDAEVGEHEPDHDQAPHERQHDREEPSHQADALAVTASTLEAENDTPERSAIDQVIARRSVTFTGVNWPSPRTSPATLTVMTSRVPPSPTTKRWTWLMATPLASVFCCLVSKSMLGSAGPAETKCTTLVSTGKRIGCSF